MSRRTKEITRRERKNKKERPFGRTTTYTINSKEIGVTTNRV